MLAVLLNVLLILWAVLQVPPPSHEAPPPPVLWPELVGSVTGLGPLMSSAAAAWKSRAPLGVTPE